MTDLYPDMVKFIVSELLWILLCVVLAAMQFWGLFAGAALIAVLVPLWVIAGTQIIIVNNLFESKESCND